MNAHRTRGLDWPPSPLLSASSYGKNEKKKWESAIGFAAVFHSKNQNRAAEVVEADSIVSASEAELGRFDVLEALNIAFAGGEITSHGVQDAERGGLVDSAQVGFGLLGPGDLLPHRLPACAVGIERGAAHAFKVFGGKSELGEHILVGNGFVVLEPDLGGINSAGFFLADRLVLNGSVGETAGHRVGHDLEQTDDGVELSGVELIDEMVSLLFFVCGCH